MRGRTSFVSLGFLTLAVACTSDSEEPNRRPSLSLQTDGTVTVLAGEASRVQMSMSDPDRDAIGPPQVIEGPGFVSIEDFSQTPGLGRAIATLVIAPPVSETDGTFNVALRVEDSHGAADTAVCPVAVHALVDSVAVAPDNATVLVGATVQLGGTSFDVHGNALGRSITWSSSDPDVATVGISGLVTGVAVGSVTITATSEGKSGNAEITVIHDISIQWVASGPILDFTSYVDAEGRVVSREFYRWFDVISGAGDVEFTGTHRETGASIDGSIPVQEGRRYRLKFLVNNSGKRTAVVNETCTVFDITSPSTATPRTLVWYAHYDPDSDGQICPESYAMISLTADNAVASLTLSPTTASIGIGGTQTFTGTLRDADGVLLDRQIWWWSSNEAVATVNIDGDGLVTGVGQGTAIITAMSEGISADATLVVDGTGNH